MRELRSYLIISGILIVLYVVAQYYKPKPTDWSPSYLKEDKIPFGTYILHKEIGSLLGSSRLLVSRQPVYNTLKGRNYKSSNYLILAGTLDLDQNDYQQMETYLRNGNDVFIAAFEPGKLLRNVLKLNTNGVFNVMKTKRTPINFVNPALKAPVDYRFDKGLGDQYYSGFDTTRVTVLGKNKYGYANFIKYNFGKGNLYLLPNPQLLTNYSLINPMGAAYAAKALSYLKQADLLIWDENNTRGNIDDDAVLRVIFKHARLRWAYYLALFSLLAFVLFEIKRRQRIIPVTAPLSNASVDFVRVVGKVYYQQRNNADIAKKKINYFLEFIRSNYRLKTNSLNQEFAGDLRDKSGATEETILQLLGLITSINAADQVNDDQLISLNKLMEQFYKQVQ